MLSARGNAQPGEPPAKKLRIAKQKPGIIHQLPSPDAALGSSSQTAGLPSSTSPKRKFSQSFRDRIFTQNDDPLVEVPNNLPSQQKARPKTTIAPIFKQNITSTFQAAPESSYRVPSARLAPIRELSPETDPEDLIKRLKKYYLDSAETLHERAAIQLQQTHSDLSRKLRETLKGEDAFLKNIEKQDKTLCAPLDQFTIRFQQHDPVDGSVRMETESVGNLIEDVLAHVTDFESDLTKLWEEFQAADAEVARVYREKLSENRDGEGVQLAETLNQLRAAIKNGIQEAEEEITELGNVAVAAMKDVEKDFRKATLPDLHIFFQSIDEP